MIAFIPSLFMIKYFINGRSMPEKPKESLSSSAARMAYVLYIGQIFAVIVSVVTFVVLTRMLGPSNYGFYILAVSFAAIIGGMQNFGIGAYMNRNLARQSASSDSKGISRTISSGFALLLPVAALITLLGIGLSGVVAGVVFGSAGVSSLSLALASLWIFFMMLQNTAIMTLVGLSRPTAAATITVAIDVVQLISILALLYIGMGVNGALIGMLIGYAFGAFVAVIYSIRIASMFKGFSLRMPSRNDIYEVFKFSAPLGLINITKLATQNLSVLILGIFTSAVVLGNYSAAMKGFLLTTTIFTTSSTLLIPVFSRAGHGAKARKARNASYDKIILYSLIFSMPIIIYIGAMASPGLSILLSNKYAYAPMYLTLIAFGTAISMIGVSLSSLIISEGATKHYLRYSIASMLIQLAAMAVLVPYFNVIGVIASVFFIGSITSNLLFIRFAARELKARLSYLRMHLILLANLILALPLLAMLLLPWHVLQLAAGIIVLLLVYPIILGLMRLVERSDLDRLAASTSSIKYAGVVVRMLCRYTAIFLSKNGAPNA